MAANQIFSGQKTGLVGQALPQRAAPRTPAASRSSVTVRAQQEQVSPAAGVSQLPLVVV